MSYVSTYSVSCVLIVQFHKRWQLSAYPVPLGIPDHQPDTLRDRLPLMDLQVVSLPQADLDSIGPTERMRRFNDISSASASLSSVNPLRITAWLWIPCEIFSFASQVWPTALFHQCRHQCSVWCQTLHHAMLLSSVKSREHFRHVFRIYTHWLCNRVFSIHFT